MKTILIIITAVFLSGCATQNRCNRKYPPQITTIIKDSTVTKFDTVTYSIRYVHYDTIRLRIDSLVTVIQYDSDGLAWSEPSILENEFCRSVAQINRSLRHELKLKEQVRMLTGTQIAEIIQKYTEYYRSSERVQEIPVNYLTGWQWFQVWCGRLFIASVVLLIGWIALPKLIKLL